MAMSDLRQLSRRSFVASVATLGGGLALGFHLPISVEAAHAAEGPTEVNAWVVIHPDDAVVIRVARSEMGQGITTALPMLVAEELECDWNRVRAEFPTADENLRRKRAWGDMSTGGSRSVRTSLRRHRAKSGLWRHAQIIRREQDPRPQGGSAGRAVAERGRRCRRQLVAGENGG